MLHSLPDLFLFVKLGLVRKVGICSGFFPEGSTQAQIDSMPNFFLMFRRLELMCLFALNLCSGPNSDFIM